MGIEETDFKIVENDSDEYSEMAEDEINDINPNEDSMDESDIDLNVGDHSDDDFSDNEEYDIENDDFDDGGDEDDDDDDDDDDVDEEDGPMESDAESDTSSVKSLAAGREDIEEDDLIKKIKKSKKVVKNHPPDILCDEMVASISFSPSNDFIAVGDGDGDISIYSYDLEKNELMFKYAAHNGSVRRVEYDEDGGLLYSISDDKSIIVADASTGKYKNAYDNAHNEAIYSLFVINKNLFATGDDDGVVKLWDRRKQTEVMSMKICDEYISSLRCVEQNSTLACTSGDGTLSGLNMNTRKIISKSEPYEADLTCSGLFCSNTKMVVGTAVGSLLLYSWGQFSNWTDEFPGVDKSKCNMNCMTPITQNIVVTGLDDGNIRATHLFPMRHIGIVGKHGQAVEGMDINKDGNLIATHSTDHKISFWDIEYFEEIVLTDKDKKDNDKAKANNLPSSSGVNASDFFAGLA